MPNQKHLRSEPGNLPVTVEGNVDTTTNGSYTLTYKAEYKDVSDSKTFTVIVASAPQWSEEDLILKQSTSPFGMTQFVSGLTVTGYNNSNLLQNIEIVENEVDMTTVGEYICSATVADPVTGFISTYDRTISIIANAKPVISGISNISIEQGSVFDAMDGVSVSDVDDEDISVDDITVEGTVDTSVLGDVVLTDRKSVV